MVDIALTISDIYNYSSVVCLTCFGVVLYNYISHLRCINFLELPPRRVLYKILAVGASIKLIEEGCCSVDAGLKLFTRKCHIDAPSQ